MIARTEVRRRLLAVLAANLSPGDLPATVDDSTGLLAHGIGLDSVEILSLVCAIEEAFDITFDDHDLKDEHFDTVGSVTTFIEQRLVS